MERRSKGVRFHKKSRYPLRVAEIQNEVRMQITKHDGNRMVLDHGHTSGSSGNTTPSQIPTLVDMRSVASQDKKLVRRTTGMHIK